MTEDLFGAMDAPEDMTRPLAVRMRPSSVDEVVGQSRVLGQGSPLRRLANPASKGSLTAPSSIILFGPPGVGKTTLAYIVAKQSGRVFEELSAVTSGVKDVRDVLRRAHDRLVAEGKKRYCSSTKCTDSPNRSRMHCCQAWKTVTSLSLRPPRKSKLFHHQTVVKPIRGRQTRIAGTRRPENAHQQGHRKRAWT